MTWEELREHIPLWIILNIVAELQRAEQKHPQWPTDIIHAAAVVGEESGELTQAALQYHYENGGMATCQVEAIHVAVTAIRFLKNSKNSSYERPGQKDSV